MMKQRRIENLTGIFTGVYRPVDAARYIRVGLPVAITATATSRRVTRWIKSGLSDPELKGQSGRDMTLSFEDLVSMRVIATLRSAGVKFQKIRIAEEWLRRKTGHPRPFAVEQMWTESSDVFMEMRRQLVVASLHGQYAMDLLRDQLIPVHGLSFNSESVACLWEPMERIIIDPELQFGQSCIYGTGITTRSVASMVDAGDSPSLIAESYRISIDEVESALSWEHALAA